MERERERDRQRQRDRDKVRKGRDIFSLLEEVQPSSESLWKTSRRPGRIIFKYVLTMLLATIDVQSVWTSSNTELQPAAS